MVKKTNGIANMNPHVEKMNEKSREAQNQYSAAPRASEKNNQQPAAKTQAYGAQPQDMTARHKESMKQEKKSGGSMQNQNRSTAENQRNAGRESLPQGEGTSGSRGSREAYPMNSQQNVDKKDRY